MEPILFDNSLFQICSAEPETSAPYSFRNNHNNQQQPQNHIRPHLHNSNRKAHHNHRGQLTISQSNEGSTVNEPKQPTVSVHIERPKCPPNASVRPPRRPRITSKVIPDNARTIVHKPCDILVQHAPTHVVINHPDVIIHPAPVIFHKPAAVVPVHRRYKPKRQPIHIQPCPLAAAAAAAVKAAPSPSSGTDATGSSTSKQTADAIHQNNIPRRRTQRERNHQSPAANTATNNNNLPIVIDHGELRATLPKVSSTQCTRFGAVNSKSGGSRYYSPAGMREISFVTADKSKDVDATKAASSSSKDEPIYNPQCPKQQKLLNEQAQYVNYHGRSGSFGDDGKKSNNNNNGDVVEFNENEKNEYVIDEKKLRTDNLEVEEVADDRAADAAVAKHQQQLQQQPHHCSGEYNHQPHSVEREQQHRPPQIRNYNQRHQQQSRPQIFQS